MRSGRRLAFPVALAVLCGDLSWAHHSPAQYEEFVIVERVATVISFEFRNPHSYILVRDSDAAEWVLETSSAVRLRRKGWSAGLFSPGDTISFRAHANRDPQKNRLYLNSVTAANGLSYALLDNDGESPEPAAASVATSLEGTWRVATDNFDDLFAAFEQHPLTDKALRARAAFNESMDPVADCVAYPSPQLVLVSYIYPMRIELADDKVRFHHEFFNTVRSVYMDGRSHPDDMERTNQGHAIGYWDDGTLVVDSRFFADHRNPMLGDFPSGAGKHVIERYTLGEGGTRATVNIFVEDPEYLAEPMNYQLTLRFAPDEELQDFECDPAIARRFAE